MGCLSVLYGEAAVSQDVLGAGGTRTCAGRVGRRVSQGGGATSKWNHDEGIVARATGRLTNWYLQVSNRNPCICNRWPFSSTEYDVSIVISLKSKVLEAGFWPLWMTPLPRSAITEY